MGLSRRKFTKEFRIAALRQLDAAFRSQQWRDRVRSIRACCIAGVGIFSRHRSMRFPVWARREQMRIS